MKSDDAGLTKTQIQIVQALSDGLTAEEVASARFRSVGTVRKHVEQARERMGARNVAHLVKLALLRGLINSVVLALVLSSALNTDPTQRRVRLVRSFSVTSGRVVRHEV